MFNETVYLNGLGIAPWAPSLIGVGGSIGGGIAASKIGGAWGGPIGAGISALSALLAGIFGAHRAKVQREDEISGAWAASGPQAIEAVMQAYRSGQVSGAQASAALDQIESQFRSMAQPITKYQGKFGSYPNAEGARPPNQCNWACGTSWDLHQQIKNIKAGISTSATGSTSIGNLGLPGDPIVLAGFGILAYMLLR